MVRHQPKECRKTQRLLNDFIAGELSVESSQEILQHLEHCHVCQEEKALKEEIRLAIRQSWTAQAMPSGLSGRIGKSVLPKSAAPGTLLRLAAGFILALAALYLATLLVPETLSVLAVDHYHEVVQDHLRCPESLHPSKASFQGDSRAEELKALETNLQNALQEAPLVSAHLCHYAGLDFVHFVFKGPQGTFSIILEERGMLQRLAAVEFSQQRNLKDIAVRLMERDGTWLACFQSQDYFVYLVLNEGSSQQSYRLAQTLFPSIHRSLETL